MRNLKLAVCIGTVAIAMAGCSSSSKDTTAADTTAAAATDTTAAAAAADTTVAAASSAAAADTTAAAASSAAGAETTVAGAAATPAAMMGNCEVEGTPGSIKLTPAKAGQLSLVTSLPAPGWYNGDDPTSIKDGYEYCMASEIAYLAGLPKVSLSNVNFDQLVAGTVKDYDLGLAEASITDPRKLVLDFTEPYFASDIGLLADATKAATYVDTASLKDAVIGVQTDTTGANFIMANLKGKVKEIKVLPDAATLMTARVAGQIDIAATDTSIVQEQEKKEGGKSKVVGQFKTGESYGGILPKGSANKAALDEAVKQMQTSGFLGKLAAKYLSGDPSVVPVFKVS